MSSCLLRVTIYNVSAKHILQQITALSDVPDPAVLKRLIDELRVSDKEPTLANQNIQELIDILRQHPEYADGLSSFVLKLIIEYRQIALYTDIWCLGDNLMTNYLNLIQFKSQLGECV